MDIVTEHIIKGIIVSHSKTGITLKEIENTYYECVGETWTLAKKNESRAIQYLERMPCVSSIRNDKNETIWYIKGKTLNGQHRVRICRPRKPKYRMNEYPRGHHVNNNNNNNNNHVGDKSNDSNKYFKQIECKDSKSGSQFSKSMSSDGSGKNSCNSIDEPKTSAFLYNWDLLGDDFLLQLAQIDLGCQPMMNRNGVLQCGLCKSGQRIKGAITQINRFTRIENLRLILNVGSVDILCGEQLSDICHDYLNLVKLCERRNIDIVITTLAPLANILHDQDSVAKINEFNSFLMSRFSAKHQVIDLTYCMKCRKTNRVWFDCYQPTPKYVTGTKEPHVLWNRIGRQRVLKHIKNSLVL